jgi:hypothetical protein
MEFSLDLILTALAIFLAVAYLVWRKIKAHHNLVRDWSSGHVEACGSCPAIESRAELKKKIRERMKENSKTQIQNPNAEIKPAIEGYNPSPR